ncbi:hypothetical protein PENTCL1PPCAC_13702 [Pristionchus entomophagus]|uniref:Carboxylesterase type B domain-containing protein n=1 Tax=Pristionchus entomophagus TaxID=358040 RepID=A0AAV5T7G8_9BILA|nr:hypothetical protein PENTCL1PPCAC_13702 [Pristionchus entomophagus]
MSCFSVFPPSETILTTYGKVEGKRMIQTGSRQVDGIPYAKPPVGELRFKKPMPLDSWEEVLSTREHRARSIQKNFYMWDNIKKGKPSEDCLYLNVFMPCWTPPTSGFPVMVFIHGGAFVMDGASNYGDIEICRNIVSREVVFVSIQYRVGYLGFWTTGDEACPGNNGLWDQLEALKWIKGNIERFGGDPTLDRLRKIPADEFAVNAIRGDEAGEADLGELTITPVLDGIFLPEGLDELRKKAKPKPLLTGVTRLEALMFANDSIPADADTLQSFVRSLIPSDVGDQDKIYESLYRRYLPPGRLANKATFLRGVIEVLSDRFINTPTLLTAKEMLERRETPVYLYVFDFLNRKSLGLARFWMSIVEASHGSELAYFFGTGITWKFTFNTDDIEMAHLIVQAFTNFAKCSDPNGVRPHDSLPVRWNVLSTIRPTTHFVFGRRPKMSDDFFQGRPMTLLEMMEEPANPGFS